MAEWQDQLNTILSNPEAMAQIAALAQSISGGPGAPPEESAGAPQRAVAGEGSPSEGGEAPDLSAMLVGLDPELVNRLVPLMNQLNRPESGQAAALLQALRPYLSEKRRDKVERATQLARLIHLGKTFLTA